MTEWEVAVLLLIAESKVSFLKAMLSSSIVTQATIPGAPIMFLLVEVGCDSFPSIICLP